MILVSIIINVLLILYGYYLGLQKGKKDLEKLLKRYPDVNDALRYSILKEQEAGDDPDPLNDIEKGL